MTMFLVVLRRSMIGFTSCIVATHCMQMAISRSHLVNFNLAMACGISIFWSMALLRFIGPAYTRSHFFYACGVIYSTAEINAFCSYSSSNSMMVCFYIRLILLAVICTLFFAERLVTRHNAETWETLQYIIVFLWPSDIRMVAIQLSLFLICTVIEKALKIRVNLQLGQVIDTIADSGSKKQVLLYVALLYLSDDIMLRFKTSIWRPLQDDVNEKTKTKCFNYIMDLSRDFHDTKNPGELRQLLAYGTALGELLNLIAFSLIPTMVELLIAIYILFIRFGLYMAMTNLLTILLFSWSSHKFLTRQKVKLEEWDAAQENQEKVLYEAVTNWLTVTYFNRVNREKDRYLRTVQNLSRAGNRYKHWADLKAMVNQGILKAGYACACLIVLSQIHQEQKSSDIVLVATNWRDLISPFQKLDSLAESFNTKFTDARRIILLLKRAPSVQDQAHAASLSLEAPGSVQFNKITFAYPGRPQNVLQQISFECQAGKTTAIVGKTGSGKTTIFNLILRQFDPDGGAVMINQQDVRTVTIDSIRESIGIVPQDAILFNASIEYNLQYANPNASQDDIEKACTEVHLHHWIQSLPDGYKTIVGDKGLKLSGGERQRLSIAQVILKNPKILLLDEATSSVDYETERVIQGAFEKLMSGRTVIVIAHRLPTVRHANRIIVLKGAKISDQGTHAELMSRAGYYRDVLNRNGLLVSSTNDEKTVSS